MKFLCWCKSVNILTIDDDRMSVHHEQDSCLGTCLRNKRQSPLGGPFKNWEVFNTIQYNTIQYNSIQFNTITVRGPSKIGRYSILNLGNASATNKSFSLFLNMQGSKKGRLIDHQFQIHLRMSSGIATYICIVSQKISQRTTKSENLTAT